MSIVQILTSAEFCENFELVMIRFGMITSVLYENTFIFKKNNYNNCRFRYNAYWVIGLLLFNNFRSQVGRSSRKCEQNLYPCLLCIYKKSSLL